MNAVHTGVDVLPEGGDVGCPGQRVPAATHPTPLDMQAPLSSSDLLASLESACEQRLPEGADSACPSDEGDAGEGLDDDLLDKLYTYVPIHLSSNTPAL